jgi:transcriptional regulator with XRE-family HTH domain
VPEKKVKKDLPLRGARRRQDPTVKKRMGARIKEAILATNAYTYSDVAERIGVRPSIVSRWASGAVLPNMEKLADLCALTLADPWKLLLLDERRHGAVSLDEATKRLQRVLDAREVGERTRDDAERELRALLAETTRRDGKT